MKKAGFSILELSIVIMVSGMIMTGMLALMNSVSTNNRAKKNVEKLEQIKSALNAFMRTNNRLPCPANPTLAINNPSYGNEAVNASTGICDYTLTYGTSQVDAGFQNHTLSLRNINTIYGNTPHKLIFGAIPFKALKLSEQYMYDEYGNKITYLTAQGYATDRARSTNPIYQRIIGWARVAIPAKMHRASASASCNTAVISESATATNDNFCLERISSNCLSASNSNPLITTNLIASGVYIQNANNVRAGDAIINTCRLDVLDYIDNYITRENLAYAIISHGKNGFGAWNKGGTLNPQPTSTHEKLNTFEYYHLLYPSHSLMSGSNAIRIKKDLPQQDFDDDVIYQTVDDVLLSIGRQNNVYCHQSTAFIDVPAGSPVDINCHFWYPIMDQANITRDIKLNQPVNNTSCDTAGSRKLTCSAGGMWVNPV